jgi:hypothetical protein
MTKRFAFFLMTWCACGPNNPTGGDGGPDATADTSIDAPKGNDASEDAAPDVASDAGADVVTPPSDGGACANQVQAVIDSGCTRCWPADLVMCSKGNAGAVEGMLACLTGGMCWSEFDYNSAGPCMQNVISTYGDSNTTAVSNKLQGLSCSAYLVLGFTALTAEMSSADRATFSTCVNALTTCDQNALQTCLNMTQYNASLCMN